MSIPMKALIVLLNLGTLTFAVMVGFSEPPHQLGELLLFLLFLVTPVVNLFALLLGRPSTEAVGWLELWLRRKTAEERKRLKELEAESR